MIPLIGVVYDDVNPESYAGIQLRFGHGKEVFNSGNPTVDYFTAYWVIFKRCKDAGVDVDDVPIMGSSSIDHFVMDGGILNDSDPSQEDMDAAIAAAKAYLGIAT